MDSVVSLCKRRGFIFPGSAVYGGLANSWDYGPLGVELKNNVKRAWWRSVVYDRDDMDGLDSAIITNRLVWKYSGHEATFSDPLFDCRACRARSRADQVYEAQRGQPPKNLDEVNAAIKKHLQVTNLQIALVTEHAEAMKKALVAGAPTPITYGPGVEKSAEHLAEDKAIAEHPLGIPPSNVSIQPVSEFAQ